MVFYLKNWKFLHNNSLEQNFIAYNLFRKSVVTIIVPLLSWLIQVLFPSANYPIILFIELLVIELSTVSDLLQKVPFSSPRASVRIEGPKIPFPIGLELKFTFELASHNIDFKYVENCH